jgi:hypothetical protein
VLLTAGKSNDTIIGSFKKRVPRIYLRALCKGMVLGESDINNGETKYTSTFTAVRDSTVYEMPMKTYKHCIKTYHKNRAKSIKENILESGRTATVITNALQDQAQLKAMNDER